MTDLRQVCEHVFKRHTKEIEEIGFNSYAIQTLVAHDYPSLDKESVNRAADVIQLMLMNSHTDDSLSA